ncbi:CLC_0170 family protein [Paenibacillus hexagrammi]|uniref:Uncharacterized protein n=1 Tax=Paenibacillus hexagrammi TaxID=2908839 RepID=A0ABY3SLZ2_9BACL|nr:CLC_0170 family protein [Paenibacillus sp. YPD9-1]UJF34206.1 hypothetical protein L0M14_02945 [Paenibacillus sp. YPD9-1]
MASGLSIGYIQFTVLLLWLSGILILKFDVSGYASRGYQKEERIARYLGWFQIVAGSVAFLTNWIWQKIYW